MSTHSKSVVVSVRDLRVGDVLSLLGLTVVGVDCFASVCIVELSDGTATAPIPAHYQTAIEPRVEEVLS